MATTNQHIIQKQIVRLNVPSRDQAFGLQTEFLEVLKEKVMPRIEGELDKLSQEGKVIKIDQLQLDLGEISPVRLKGDLSDILLAKFRDEIHRLLLGIDSGVELNGVEVVRKSESDLDHLAHFLKTGTVNWQVKSSFFRPESILERQLEESPQALRKLILQIPTAKTRLRLVQQFAPKLVEKVIQLLDPNWATLTNSLNSGWKKFDREYPGLASQNLENERESLFFQLSVAIARALPGKESEILNEVFPQFNNSLKAVLQSDPQQNKEQFLTLLLAYLVKANFSEAHVLAQVISQASSKKIAKLLAEVGVLSTKQVTAGFDQLLRELKAIDLPKRTEVLVRNWVAEAILNSESFAKANIAPIQLLLELQNSQVELPKEILNRYSKVMKAAEPKLKAAKDKKAEEASQKEPVDSLPDELYVDNAGLVLLNPFVPHCFEGLGWTKSGAFTEEKHRENGLMMFRYLSHGSEEPQGEHELVLNKLMVGLEADAPIRSNLGLSPEEMAEGETLLKSAIAYWDKLGEVDPEQFRETFLRREGRLTWEGSGWNLKVDRQTYDVLLKFLPWSFGIVKFPWMEKMITVDW